MTPPPLPRRQRPTGAGVIGMLYMIFGGLGLLGATIGVLVVPAMTRVIRDVAPADPAADAMAELFSEPIFPLLLAIGLVQSAVVVAGGFGLWTMKPWGRRLGEAATWIWLVSTVASSLISFRWVEALMSTMSEIDGAAPPPPGFDAAMRSITIGSVVFNVVLYGGLLGWALWYLRKPDVKSAYGD